MIYDDLQLLKFLLQTAEKLLCVARWTGGMEGAEPSRAGKGWGVGGGSCVRGSHNAERHLANKGRNNNHTEGLGRWGWVFFLEAHGCVKGQITPRLKSLCHRGARCLLWKFNPRSCPKSLILHLENMIDRCFHFDEGMIARCGWSALGLLMAEVGEGGLGSRWLPPLDK